MKFLNGWAILWVLFMVFSVAVNIVGGLITGQLYLLKSMVLSDFAGTLVVSLVAEVAAYLIPERRNNE